MSEEWIWNKEQPSTNHNPSKEEEVQNTESNSVNMEQEATEKQNVDTVDATPDAENLAKMESAATEEQDTTYSWVNPDYQKRRQEAGQGYYGGSYHGDWKEQQRQNQEAKAEGQPGYSKYQLDPELSDKPKKTKEKNGMFGRIMKTAACAVVFGVVAGAVMFGVNKVANHFWPDEPAKQVSNVQLQQGGTSKDDTNAGSTNTGTSGMETPGNITSGSGYTVAQVAESCMPSVVSITNASVTTVKNYFGGTQEYESKSSGSGIIVGQNEEELLIATNNHVIDGAETITIAFCDESVYEAQKKGSASNADLAVVAVKLSDMTKETLDAIRIIQIADAEDIQIGEQVVAIGNALGYGQSVTSGWVSAVDRTVEDEDGNTADSLIQTDAAINPGNSGGALLNMRGELIGINSAKINSTKVEGMGYAISIGKAEPILNELMNLKTRYKVDAGKAAYIGVTCYNVDAIVTQMYGIPAGAFIDSVEENGPAAKAGIKKSDVIVKFDGQTITSSTQLVELLEYYEAGEVVEVVVARAGEDGYKEIILTATLGNKKNMKNKIE